jgi:hypothetical protein
VQQLNLSRALHLTRGGTTPAASAAPVVCIVAQNHSGGALARGDVVVLDKTNSRASLLHVTTTTSANDVDVVGMVFEPIADGAVGRVQIWGPTDALKVDGSTNVAVGDLLGTFTTAKIAAKSTTAGRFARAMEAYATDDAAGVIDAFLTNLNLGAFTTE